MRAGGVDPWFVIVGPTPRTPRTAGSYLNEFVFRFNRRRSRSRGLVFYRVLELAAAHHPVRYRDLIATPRPTPRPARRHEPADTPPAWSAHRPTAPEEPLRHLTPLMDTHQRP